MIQQKIKGAERFRHADYEAIRREVNANRLSSTTPGISIARQNGVTTFQYLDPLRTRWVYVTRITDDGTLVGKEAHRGATGSSVSENPNDVIVGDPAPGYTSDHFEHFVIDGPQPVPEDRACLYIGGFFVPDFRMLLVEPVAVEELCEPCVEVANA